MTRSSTEINPPRILKSVDSATLIKELPGEKLAWMLQKMCETRYFEEKAEELYTRGLVHGTMHLSIGMEASPVGSIAAIEAEDWIIHHHRGHGHTIAKGADITIMMAEFLGKEPDICYKDVGWSGALLQRPKLDLLRADIKDRKFYRTKLFIFCSYLHLRS